MLAIGGFTNDGAGDVSDLTILDLSGEKPAVAFRLLRRGDRMSSIRTLRAADLDGDGRDEIVALGRAGDEERDSAGDLRVFTLRDGDLQSLASRQWQSGTYTHGFGMELGDLDGDGKPEIVTGGFFSDGKQESAELQVWRLEGAQLNPVARRHWKSLVGETRINSIAIGDVRGDGSACIVSGGRTGQLHGENETNTAEGDQLIVWSLSKSELVQVAAFEAEPREINRIREVKLADLDGKPGLELLAVGRRESPRRATGAGGGRGGGKGGGDGGSSIRLRPTLKSFRLNEAKVVPVTEVDFGDAAGEIRDLAVLPTPKRPTEFVTITAHDEKPQRKAKLTLWIADQGAIRSRSERTVSLGDETRARQIVLWPEGDRTRLLSVGFVMRNDQILGQLLDWGSPPADTRDADRGPSR